MTRTPALRLSIMWLSCVLLAMTATSWARSYEHWDNWWLMLPGNAVQVNTMRGIVQLRWVDVPASGSRPWSLQHYDQYIRPGLRLAEGIGFKWQRSAVSNGTERGWCRDLCVPHWSLLAASGVLSGIGLRRTFMQRHAGASGVCPTCGYDLRASPQRCPECGSERESNLSNEELLALAAISQPPQSWYDETTDPTTP